MTTDQDQPWDIILDIPLEDTTPEHDHGDACEGCTGAN